MCFALSVCRCHLKEDLIAAGRHVCAFAMCPTLVGLESLKLIMFSLHFVAPRPFKIHTDDERSENRRLNEVLRVSKLTPLQEVGFLRVR